MGVKEFCTYFFNKEFMKISFPTHFQHKSYSQATGKFIRELWTLEEEYDYLKPAFFYKLISKKFEPQQQHDAHEFMIFLLS